MKVELLASLNGSSISLIEQTCKQYFSVSHLLDILSSDALTHPRLFTAYLSFFFMVYIAPHCLIPLVHEPSLKKDARMWIVLDKCCKFLAIVRFLLIVWPYCARSPEEIRKIAIKRGSIPFFRLFGRFSVDLSPELCLRAGAAKQAEAPQRSIARITSTMMVLCCQATRSRISFWSVYVIFKNVVILQDFVLELSKSIHNHCESIERNDSGLYFASTVLALLYEFGTVFLRL